MITSKSFASHYGCTTFLKLDEIRHTLAKHSPTKMQEWKSLGNLILWFSSMLLFLSYRFHMCTRSSSKLLITLLRAFLLTILPVIIMPCWRRKRLIDTNLNYIYLMYYIIINLLTSFWVPRLAHVNMVSNISFYHLQT